MSHVTRIVTVRPCDLDRYAVVPPSTLLRYLELVRWEARLDPDYPLGDSLPPDTRFFLRAQHLACGVTIGFRDVVRLEMWLQTVGTTSLTLGHRIVRDADGAWIATARAVVVLVGRDRVPVPAPHALGALLAPREDESVDLLAVEEGDAPIDSWTDVRLIRASDEDLYGHVNHGRYADLVEDTRRAAEGAEAYGQGVRSGQRPDHLSMEYRGEVRSGQRLQIQTWRSQPNILRFEGSVEGSEQTAFRAAWAYNPHRPRS